MQYYETRINMSQQNKLLNKCLLTLCFSGLLLLSGCATPAHKNSWFSFQDQKTLIINVEPEGQYFLDGIRMNANAIEIQIEQLQKARHISRVVVETDWDVTLFELAILVDILEKQNLEVYWAQWYGVADAVRASDLLDEYNLEREVLVLNDD